MVFDPQEKLRELNKAGQLPSGVVQSTAYPNLRQANGQPLAAPSWVLYVGPLDKQSDVDAACVRIRAVYPNCQAIQLQP